MFRKVLAVAMTGIVGLTLFAVAPAQAAARTSAGLAGESTGGPATQEWIRSMWINNKSNKCLGISGGNMTNGTKAIQWECTGAYDQFWYTVPLDGGYYQVRNYKNQNKCLAVPAGSHTAGTQLAIWDCRSGERDQLFAFTQYGNTALYSIQNRESAQFVGVVSGRLDNGAPVVQWPWVGASDQYWYWI